MLWKIDRVLLDESKLYAYKTGVNLVMSTWVESSV